MARLTVVLTALPAAPFARRGEYGASGQHLPSRARWLHPDAAASLVQMEQDYPGVFRYTDVLRSAESSRTVRLKNREKRRREGAKNPAYSGKLPGSSGHNVGLSTDDCVGDNLRRLAEFLNTRVSKCDYDFLKRSYGWYCHRDGPRGDHVRDWEEWHFNYFGDDPERWLAVCKTKTSAGLEAKMKARYGPFRLTKTETQECLAELGLYKGAIDGVHGRKTRAAVAAFQKHWTLKTDGVAGFRTQRVLRFVTCQFVDASGVLVVPK